MSIAQRMKVSVRDLVDANMEVYARRTQPDGPQQALPQAQVLAYVFDPKSHHGGIAYYLEQSGTLVLAHRGSATAKDWLRTDRQILFGKHETRADSHAMEFADKVLTQLQASGRPVTNIIETGHSKGGRESQMVLAKLLAEGQIPCVGLTFNSARVHPDVKKGLEDIPHINLRMDGGHIWSRDVVTSYGRHIGQTVDFPNPDVKFVVSAHSLDSFAQGLQRLPGLADMDVREAVQLCRQGLSIEEVNQYGLKSMAEMNQTLQNSSTAAYSPPPQRVASLTSQLSALGGTPTVGASKANRQMPQMAHSVSRLAPPNAERAKVNPAALAAYLPSTKNKASSDEAQTISTPTPKPKLPSVG